MAGHPQLIDGEGRQPAVKCTGGLICLEGFEINIGWRCEEPVTVDACEPPAEDLHPAIAAAQTGRPRGRGTRCAVGVRPAS